jgi:hypothetical protein
MNNLESMSKAVIYFWLNLDSCDYIVMLLVDENFVSSDPLSVEICALPLSKFPVSRSCLCNDQELSIFLHSLGFETTPRSFKKKK